jgi:large subunit ribosomal protein L1
MQALKPLARILGPKGLMPNVKSGTLVKPEALIETVKQSKQGLIEYRVNEDGTIMTKIGKRDFTDEDLVRNADSLLRAVVEKKPEVIKGRYFLKAMVKTSMGPPTRLNISDYAALASQQNQQ